METNRIGSGQSQPPAQLTSAKGKDGESAFHDMAKSKGNSAGDLEQATSERTRLTRTRRADKNGNNKSISSLFKVLNGGDTEEEAVYYTVLDPTTGQIMTLRLLAVA